MSSSAAHVTVSGTIPFRKIIPLNEPNPYNPILPENERILLHFRQMDSKSPE